MVVVDKHFWNVSKNIVPHINFHWKNNNMFESFLTNVVLLKVVQNWCFFVENAAIGAVS